MTLEQLQQLLDDMLRKLDRLEEERTKRREEDWKLASLAAEFGFKSRERGHNWERVLSHLAEIFDTPRAPTEHDAKSEPGLWPHDPLDGL
jgi:hypothetical protein